MFENQITQSIEAGAPDITYSGNEGPKSPQQEQMMEQQMMEQEQQMMAPVDYSSPAFKIKLIEGFMRDEGLDLGAATAKAEWIIREKLKPRQGAAFGGIMGLDGRRQYGLGSKLKKTIRKIIPNEVAEIAEKAAPYIAMVAPQFALPAALAGGLGRFDRTGRMGESLMSGLSTYGLGQISPGLPGVRDMGPSTGMFSKAGAMGGKYNLKNIMAARGDTANQVKINQGITADAATNGGMDAYVGMGDPVSTGMNRVGVEAAQNIPKGFLGKTLDKVMQYVPTSLTDLKDPKKLLGAAGILTLGTKLLGGGPEQTIDTIMARGEGYDMDDIRTRVTAAYKDPSGKLLADLRLEFPYLGTQASKNTAIMANGGRIGYGLGSLVSGSAGVFKPTSDSMSAGDAPSFEGGSGMGGMIADLIRKNPQMFSDSQNTSLGNQGFVNQGNQGFNGMFSKFFTNPKMYNQYLRNKEDFIDENLNEIDDREEVNMAYGGRIRRAEGGLMDLGGMELDYRAEGGFVPIGAKEKADDVPARLSVNEFVFTADAVRSAGGGDIDKGAEVMERVMKNLEAGGQISEDSQGMQGAREMFQTSQRLGEVL